MVTGAIYKGFVFDGIDSKQYGVYITGQGVFDAPVRDVEMIEIPGRNGSYALDKGRFKNIEVTYPAGMFGNTDAEFMQGISNLRNALASRKGYCRLTDEYNPNEYRMAVYKSGLEVSPAQLKAGQFDITFECKPQRFLTSGETEQTVTSGATITNPTLFDSHPLLLVDGYGDFDINGEEISIQQGAVLGNTIIASPSERNFGTIDVTLNKSLYLTSDIITVSNPATLTASFELAGAYTFVSVSPTNSPTGYDWLYTQINPRKFEVTIFRRDTPTFTAGTTSSESESGHKFNFDLVVDQSGTQLTTQFSISFTYKYTAGTSDTLNASGLIGIIGSNYFAKKNFTYIQTPTVYVDSTKSALGQLYIDLDIGECYRIENGEYISINTATTLPADLPVLNPGANTITYDNTFTSFKVTPRWWKV